MNMIDPYMNEKSQSGINYHDWTVYAIHGETTDNVRIFMFWLTLNRQIFNIELLLIPSYWTLLLFIFSNKTKYQIICERNQEGQILS